MAVMEVYVSQPSPNIDLCDHQSELRTMPALGQVVRTTSIARNVCQHLCSSVRALPSTNTFRKTSVTAAAVHGHERQCHLRQYRFEKGMA